MEFNWFIKLKFDIKVNSMYKNNKQKHTSMCVHCITFQKYAPKMNNMCTNTYKMSMVLLIILWIDYGTTEMVL